MVASAKKSAEKSMTAMFMALTLWMYLTYLTGHWNRDRALHLGDLEAPLVGHRVALLVVSMPVAIVDIKCLTNIIIKGLALLLELLVAYHVLSVAPLVAVAMSVVMAGKSLARSSKADNCECNGDIGLHVL